METEKNKENGKKEENGRKWKKSEATPFRRPLLRNPDSLPASENLNSRFALHGLRALELSIARTSWFEGFVCVCKNLINHQCFL